MLHWTVEPSSLTCSACGASTTGVLIARRLDLGHPFDLIVCDGCGSVTVRGADGGPAENDAAIDEYVEFRAGVGALLRNYFRTPGHAIGSVLEIGCGFGFGLAYADRVLGIDARGVDPGAAARRGTRELAVSIADAFFGAETDLGRTFDLVIASEVIEHVQDPLGLLTAVRRHLAPGGRLILTTPDAGSISPRRETTEQVVDVGAHFILFKAAALRNLLVSAGFLSAVVDVEGETLVACAAIDEAELSTHAYGPTDEVLDAFYADIAAGEGETTSLSLGMTVRRYALAVARGAWDEIRSYEHEAFERFRGRHGADLRVPASVVPGPGAGALLVIAHGAALSRLARGVDAAPAIAYLELAERAALLLEDAALGMDAGSRQLLDSVIRHRPIAVARTQPEQAPEAARALVDQIGIDASAEWVTRTFCELALRGALGPAERIALEAKAGFAALDSDLHGLRIAMDAARSLAVIALERGEGWITLGWLGFEEDLLTERASGLLDDSEIETRRTDIRALRGSALALPEALAAPRSPSIAPSDEMILWGDYPAESDLGVDRISVVLALYNGAHYIQRTVQSIAAQSLSPLELIVVDDGSTDGSVGLIESFGLPFPVRVIRRPNGGQSSARNVGVRAARGEFIAFIDQDDEWRPNHLEVLQPVLSGDGDLAWVFADFDAVDGDGRTIVRYFVTDNRVPHPRNSIVGIIASDLMALPSASLLRRRALHSVRGFDRRLVGYEDDDLFVRIFRRGWTYGYVPISTVRYRIHAGGASRSNAFLRSRLVFFETLLRAVPDDHRLGIFLSGSIIPRFFQVTLREYSEALAFREFDRAKELADCPRTHFGPR